MEKLIIVPNTNRDLVFVAHIISQVTGQCIRVVQQELDSYRDPTDRGSFKIDLHTAGKLFRAQDAVATWHRDSSIKTIGIVTE